MTHQEIKELAGHRVVSPWIMKLVGDALAKEREAVAKLVEPLDESLADAIRARGTA